MVFQADALNSNLNAKNCSGDDFLSSLLGFTDELKSGPSSHQDLLPFDWSPEEPLFDNFNTILNQQDPKTSNIANGLGNFSTDHVVGQTIHSPMVQEYSETETFAELLCLETTQEEHPEVQLAEKIFEELFGGGPVVVNPLNGLLEPNPVDQMTNNAMVDLESSDTPSLPCSPNIVTLNFEPDMNGVLTAEEPKAMPGGLQGKVTRVAGRRKAVRAKGSPLSSAERSRAWRDRRWVSFMHNLLLKP